MRDKRELSGVGRVLSPVTIAAHELKTPLVLLRQLSLALQDKTLNESERQQIAHHMQLVSERALRLTSDITKVQRLEDALFELEPVNVAHVYHEVLYELSPLYAACGRVLASTRRNTVPLAVGNRDLLRRVMLNFADNALQYGSAEQPVELTCSLHDETTLRLGVRDYGPALDSKAWAQLEQQLYRPESITARPGSSGLGLSIARQFAEVMTGSVGMTRHRDGATFYVELPVSRQMTLV